MMLHEDHIVNISGPEDYVIQKLESKFHLQIDSDSDKSEYDKGSFDDTSLSSSNEEPVDLLKDISLEIIVFLTV